MAVARFILCLTPFVLADGARISVKPHVGASSMSATRVGPEGEPWAENRKFVCMQKWQTGGISSGKFVDSFCLANYEKAQSIASAHYQVAIDLAPCESTKYSYRMKVCALKDEAPNGRVSYSTKAHVAKSCFRFGDGAMLESAVGEEECTAEMSKSAEEQGVIKAKLTTTVTTTTPTTTTEELIKEDYFVADNDESETDEMIETKALFTTGEEQFWEYNGKAFKCCVSSKGKPTQLQDMHATELPAARSYGDATGCGGMFGDTYHNGPMRHDTCPVLASVLKEITGEEFETIKSSLEQLD